MSSGPPESAGGETGPSEESPGEQEVGDEGPAVQSTSAPRTRGASGARVLTDAVLQNQRELINELKEIKQVLMNVCTVMSDMSKTIKELVKK